jgi:hypothetical protein
VRVYRFPINLIQVDSVLALAEVRTRAGVLVVIQYIIYFQCNTLCDLLFGIVY